MKALIQTVDALEAVIGKTPPQMHLKVIDHLDAGALRWIAQSPLMFAGFGTHQGLRAMIVGGAAGFAAGDALELRLPLSLIDDPDAAALGAVFGGLFLLPGIGETLRVNGRVAALETDQVRIVVEECYGHCAKALIRSSFWVAEPGDAPCDPADFIAASRFAALASRSAGGGADLSPKGDPAGVMARLDGDTLWFSDRPGNRRADSFRNILKQPDVALVLMVPGAHRIVSVRGRAVLTTDMSVRDRFAVGEKVPLLAVGVAIADLAVTASTALARADLWPVKSPSDIDPTTLFVEHIKRNKAGGVVATLARASLAVPGMNGILKKGLDKDYRDNLY